MRGGRGIAKNHHTFNKYKYQANRRLDVRFLLDYTMVGCGQRPDLGLIMQTGRTCRQHVYSTMYVKRARTLTHTHARETNWLIRIKQKRRRDYKQAVWKVTFWQKRSTDGGGAKDVLRISSICFEKEKERKTEKTHTTRWNANVIFFFSKVNHTQAHTHTHSHSLGNSQYYRRSRKPYTRFHFLSSLNAYIHVMKEK